MWKSVLLSSMVWNPCLGFMVLFWSLLCRPSDFEPVSVCFWYPTSVFSTNFNLTFFNNECNKLTIKRDIGKSGCIRNLTKKEKESKMFGYFPDQGNPIWLFTKHTLLVSRKKCSPSSDCVRVALVASLLLRSSWNQRRS